jgi:hypothetical protein
MAVMAQASGALLEEVLAPNQIEEANAQDNTAFTGEATKEATGGSKRIELRASGEFIHALDLLADDESLSRADIIRRAIGLYARVRIEQKQGHPLAFAELKDGQLGIRELLAV